MATLIRPDNSRVELNQISFDDASNTFRLSDDGGTFQYEFRYALRKDEVEHEYEVHFLYRKDVRNEEISQLYDRESGERIGWSFPVAALTTNEHSYAENEHFLRTAFGAYKQLLAIISFEERNANDDGYLDKLLFLHPDTVIICLFRTFINEKFREFDIRNYYPSLYRFGFTVEKTDSVSAFTEQPSEKMKLDQICDLLVNEGYVREIFDGLIYERHPLARFVVLYQIVELCIDKILLRELDELTQAIRRKDLYVRDIRSKLEAFESEKKRINKLFNEYQPRRSEFVRGELLRVCREFLDSIGHSADPALDFADTFYLVRNTILHNFRSITRGMQYLDPINDLFSHLVCDLVMTYREPT